MERNNGLLSGLRPEEARLKAPRPDFMNPYFPVGKTGESQLQLYLRAGRAVQSLVRSEPGRYLVVSHGGLLNMVLYSILGLAPQANFQGARFRFRNASFASLIYQPDQHIWTLERLNDQEHWKPEDDQ